MPAIHEFSDGAALAETLAQDICLALKSGIEKNGHALLAVSGGSTPKQLFAVLSEKELPWGKVVITLVDERWVPGDHARSNALLVNTYLRVNLAKKSKFVPLYAAGDDGDQAFESVERAIDRLALPFDAVILGMGEDGHTASFFPGADNLALATDLQNTQYLSTIRAEGAQEPRVTFNLSTLIKSKYLALHIEGSKKLEVLKKALENGAADELPIRYVLRNAPQLKIYWSPKQL